MEKYSKLDPAIRTHQVGHINQRWGQLYELEKEWGERALKYLLLTNSGGAIATLGFLGASEVVLRMMPVKIALFLFVTGVFLVGVSTAKQYHHMSGLFEAWKIDVDHYFNDKITWDHLNNEDTKRAVDDFWDYAFPYGAFGCFILGCVAGGFALFGNGV